jgi:hypothetical protein
MKELWITARITLLRLLRNPTTMLVQLGVPLVLIPVLGYSLAGIPGIDAFLGKTSVMTFMAIVIITLFQLFSGGFVMWYVNDAWFTGRRWRMRLLPCGPSPVLFGVLAAGLAVSLAQGAVLAGLSSLVLGARFGHFGVALLVFLGVSLFAQMLAALLLLGLRAYGPAFSMTWLVSYGSCVLAGMIFPLPAGNPVFTFLSTYGTPASLAKTALLGASRGGAAGEVALCLGVLYLACAILGLLVSRLARRRLA